MALIDEVGRGPVAIDTAPFIYLIEESPTYLPLLETLFSAIDRGHLVGVTSELTLLEVLVVPYRKYHVVFIPKYRKKALFGQLRSDLGEVFRDLAKRKESEVMEGHLMADHYLCEASHR